MRRQVNVWVRTDRVGARLERLTRHRHATRIAQQMGVVPEILIREAEALVGRARADSAGSAARGWGGHGSRSYSSI